MFFLLLFLLAADPSTAIALLQQGLIALEHGQTLEAKADLEQASRLDPANAFVWSSLAEIYLRLKEPEKASAAAEKAEKIGSGIPAVAHALAMYYSEAGQFAHAAKLEEAYASSPKADPGALLRAASLYLEGGDAGKAIDLARRADPSAAREDVLGRALLASGQPVEGLKHLSEAWEEAKTDSRITFDYAQALLQHGDFGGAAEVVDVALAAHSEDPQLVLSLGVARYGQRRFEDAVMAFLKVIQIDPQIEQPYRFLGKMLDQAGSHLDEITQDCERWAKRNPKDAEAQLVLAKARLAKDGRDPAAEGLLRRSIALDGNDWEAHCELGILLEGRRDFSDAAKELARAVELNPKEPTPHYHLSRVYDRLGQPERAQAERALHEELTAAPR